MVLMHSGSRGLGHQVCTDYLDLMLAAMKKYRICVIDRQLACVPIRSTEGQEYLSAMAGAANFAFANRQMITHRTRQAFQHILGSDDLSVVYDVCHNIAKRERHHVEGREKEVLVHRKGATRAFPKGHPDLPAELRDIWTTSVDSGEHGHLLLRFGGDSSKPCEETFGSSCHGAGRAMSRSQAKRETTAEQLLQ